ncbi:MBL fold metallo-hydrolase [Actinomadura sediminis]|uniref:MBL fold metallo-hydrolase n=1 Tax=Actinomadura sediminis TaxID=1038904 RepID=A0ABW3EWD6_9ACTN
MHISHPAPDVTALTDAVPLPGIGFLPVNAHLLHAEQPVLVDTGLRAASAEFLDVLWSLVDPADLRWIYLTHPDRDHTGSVFEILEAAPSARLVTTFLGMGLLSLERPVPPDRVYLLNPGQSLDVGDRGLLAFRPPVYDNPATTAIIDDRTGTCFSSDCFGAPMTSRDLVESDDVAAIPHADLIAGQRLWAVLDSPWLCEVDRNLFHSSLHPLRDADPPVVLSTHLPPAHHRTAAMLDTLAGAPDAPPYIGPDQEAFLRLLTELEPATGGPAPQNG